MSSNMKYAIVLPDGAADEPVEQLDGVGQIDHRTVAADDERVSIG